MGFTRGLLVVCAFVVLSCPLHAQSGDAVQESHRAKELMAAG